MIKELETGLPSAEFGRKHDWSPATFCTLKAKYGGMDLSGARRIEQAKAVTAKLKCLVADIMLDIVGLMETLGSVRRRR